METTDKTVSREISRRLSYTLDCIGYSPKMVRERKRFWTVLDSISDNAESNRRMEVRYKTVGSRGGVATLFESDRDGLFIHTFALGVEDHIPDECPFRNTTTSVGYTIEHCLYHPGHVKLKLCLESNSVEHSGFAHSCLYSKQDGQYLSSKDFLPVHSKGFENQYKKTAGPALTRVNEMGLGEDLVPTLPCACPRILKQWRQRPRRHNWPPVQAMDKISEMTCNLVAKGIPGCPDEDMEWRICFNEIELVLVECFNGTQTKLYKILKMIKKDMFPAPSNQISSFIIKNLVFWQAETYPQSCFRSDNLMFWVIKSLRLLKRAVRLYTLPYYMIPNRNLLSEKISVHDTRQIERQITKLIRRGFHILYECERLQWAMTLTPDDLFLVRGKLEVLEITQFLVKIAGHLRYHQVVPLESFISCVITLLTECIEIVNTSPWPAAVQEQLGLVLDHFHQTRMLLS